MRISYGRTRGGFGTRLRIGYSREATFTVPCGTASRASSRVCFMTSVLTSNAVFKAKVDVS